MTIVVVLELIPAHTSAIGLPVSVVNGRESLA
jgi:hypothetical protein